MQLLKRSEVIERRKLKQYETKFGLQHSHGYKSELNSKSDGHDTKMSQSTQTHSSISKNTEFSLISERLEAHAVKIQTFLGAESFAKRY